MNRKERRAAAKSAKMASSPSGATADGLCELGFTLLKSGQVAEAERHCRQALTLQPNFGDGLHLMGGIAMSRKQHDHAIEWITGALHQTPKPEYLLSLGNALQLVGRLEEALKAYERGASLKPDDADLWNSVGFVLTKLDRIDEAISAFQHVLKLSPRHMLAAHICATLLFETKRFDEAVSYYDVCAECEPDRADVYRDRGVCHSRRSRFELALADHERALKLDPGHADTHYNLGHTQLKLGRYDDASRSLDRALALEPDRVDFLINKGVVTTERRQFAEAFAAYDRALVVEPNNAFVQWNLSLLNLRMGDFKTGWAKYEWRWKVPGLPIQERSFDRPLWLGAEPIRGKTVLLHSDQGFGDALQFCRYVPLVAAMGASVILEVQESLRELFSGLEGVSKVLAIGQSLPDFDYHCPLGSLPLAFDTTLDTIPSVTPYISVGSRAERWKSRLAPLNSPRIGLVWSGNPTNGIDRDRSMPLEALLPLLNVEARFVSLQKDVRPADRAILDQRNDILDLGPELENFADTAAVISHLDLVISVDTSVSHLAGALGRPLWILLHHVPCWRYLLDRTDSPWYPTARLFRQSETREWQTVIDQVCSELRSFIPSSRSAGEIIAL
jgi:tetratricopeptide (TPR) repeat protein